MASEHIVEVGSDNWEAEVKQSTVPVLVDVWAPWCGPCRALMPTIERIAENLQGKAKICKMNMDDNQELAINYRVSGVPHLLFFKPGSDEVAHRIAGMEREDKIVEELTKLAEA